MDLLKPKEVTVKDRDGVEHAYTLSRLPATVGREVLAKYPISNMPKLGDYAISEEIMVKMMGYVSVQPDSGPEIRLKTMTLIDNHVPDAETLCKLEMGMIEYNFGFFDKGKVSGFLSKCTPMLKSMISSILMALSDASSQQGKQPSKS